MSMLTLRELNRATLARQLLLERVRLDACRPPFTGLARSRRSGRVPPMSHWRPGSRDSSARISAAPFTTGRVVRATLMRETLHLVAAEDYPHDAVAMATYFRTLDRTTFPTAWT